MRDKYILTAESVTEGHPDKLCDAIADRVLDACLKHDPAAHVACEAMATAGKLKWFLLLRSLLPLSVTPRAKT